jgi:hypothetical protein
MSAFFNPGARFRRMNHTFDRPAMPGERQHLGTRLAGLSEYGFGSRDSESRGHGHIDILGRLHGAPLDHVDPERARLDLEIGRVLAPFSPGRSLLPGLHARGSPGEEAGAGNRRADEEQERSDLQSSRHGHGREHSLGE